MKMRFAWIGALSLLLGFSLLGMRGVSVRAQNATHQNATHPERRHSAPLRHSIIGQPIIGQPIVERLVERPIWPPRPWPQPLPVLGQQLQLEREAAKVEISNGVARTRLTQTFRNTSNRTIEGTYVFPLPSGAAVSGFAMMMNGQRVEAEILEGDRAREIYTGIVQKLRDPAILEFIDRNLLRARIFPIPAGAEQQVELEYSESLKADSSAFRYVVPLRLPNGGAAQSANVEIHLHDAGGLRAIYSPTHEVEIKRQGDGALITGEFGSNFGPRRASTEDSNSSREGADRDFVLYFTRAQTRVGLNMVTFRNSDEDGYFMLLAAPDAQTSAREIAAKDVVFVCDTSGSMSGAKIEQTKKALQTLLGNLNPDDRFNIITFSSDTHPFRDGLVAASAGNLQAARTFAGEIKAVGGTNINDVLTESLKNFPGINDGRPHQVVFMTDGQPTVGETDVAQILKNVRAANGDASGTARLFTFGVGYDVNTRLLDTLAEDNSGASDYVLPAEDIEQKVGALYARMAYPVMTNPRLNWQGLKVYDVYPKRLPDLFKGSQVVVFGRYAGNGSGAGVQLVGGIAGKPESVTGVVDFGGSGAANDSLPRLWATRKVGYLLDDARREGRTLDPEVRDEIIKLSKRYGIVTPLTAGLITEDGEPQAVDRLQRMSGSFGVAPGSPPQIMRRSGAANEGDFAARAASPMMPAPASGADAVAASKATGDLRARQTLRDAVGVRNVEGKTFFERDGIWTDGAYDAAKSPAPQSIKFASPAYFALLKDARLAKWLSVGERVLIVLPATATQAAKTIRIEP